MMRQKEENNALTHESKDKMWLRGTLTSRSDRATVQTQLYLETFIHECSLFVSFSFSKRASTAGIYREENAGDASDGKSADEDRGGHKPEQERNPNNDASHKKEENKEDFRSQN